MRRYDAAGKLVDVFVSPGSGGLSLTVGITFGPDGNLYTADALKGNILRFDGRTGAFIDAFVPTGRGGMDGPRAIQWKAKTTVCHRGRTLSIGYLSGADHLGHGDTLGRCAG